VIRLPSLTPTRIAAGSGARADGRVARVAGAEQLAESTAMATSKEPRGINEFIGVTT